MLFLDLLEPAARAQPLLDLFQALQQPAHVGDVLSNLGRARSRFHELSDGCFQDTAVRSERDGLDILSGERLVRGT